MSLADLLRPHALLHAQPELPTVMVGTVLDTSPLRVTVPSLDGGANALRAFGTLPDASAGDHVRVVIDENGRPVVIAWEAA